MSFAHEIKKEVLAKEFAFADAEAFLAGVALVSGVNDQQCTTLKLSDPEISLLVRDLAKQLGYRNNIVAGNRYFIALHNHQLPSSIKLPAYFFAGAFVGGGSISDIDSTHYHLEIQFHNRAKAEQVKLFLNKYRFNFTLIQRRSNWVLYIKKAEAISDFLRAIQAFDGLLAFEDRRIHRDWKNQLNRYSNLDVCNLAKLASASERFKAQYRFILDNSLQALFTSLELAFFELKKTNYTDSLTTLTTKMNTKYQLHKTRSGLNHWLIKLRNIYDERNI